MGIRSDNRDYERWLTAQLRGEVAAKDFDKKHKKMKESAFTFLRATYWRWAESILDVCPDLASAPSVLSVGDIHLENFGTWRDEEGRLIWGVNDFDEAAEMPYIIDLVRLATSATLAHSPHPPSLNEICTHILDGYEEGLKSPEPFVLDRKHMWLRKRFVVSEAGRTLFWSDIDERQKEAERGKFGDPSKKYLKSFANALPEDSIRLTYWPKTAGTGSLGRPRWVGYGSWRGGPLLRECKAIVLSGWSRAHRGGSKRLRINDVAKGKYRAPDPWYQLNGNVLVRRLSPNNRKLEISEAEDAPRLLHRDMLWAMGRDLAAVHLGGRNKADAIRTDLGERKQRWFRANVEAAAEFISREYIEYKK